ncbi:MAG: fungal-specific transcription factor domain-containing protein [Benjaminiella poitrasii]|nr:MAG: fungal-specific transcription factor domain-containing protein [Benjaminiella poitrasii]
MYSNNGISNNNMMPIAPAASYNSTQKTIEIERKKRTRAKRSCDSCRKKKTRCDADVNQPCTKCKLANIECQFLVEQKKRGPSSGRYVEVLENRLKRMEKLLQNIVEEKKQDDYLSDYNQNFNSSNSVSPIEEGEEEKDQEVEAGPSTSSCVMSKLKQIDRDYEYIQEQMQDLTISDYQRTRYIGASSGFHFLNEEIFNCKKKQRLPEEPSWFIQKLNDDEEEHVIIKTKEVPLEELQTNESQSQNRIELFKDTPYITEEFIDYLIHMYFTRIHNYCPIINKVQFLEQYYYHLPSTPDKYLLYTIAYIGITIFKTDISQAKLFSFTNEQLKEIESVLKAKSHKLLGIVYKRSMISTVQALMILSMFNSHSKNDDEDTSHWFMTGMAIRMAQDLGLHRDCSRWNIPECEIELRKRIWYGCYLMDRLVAAELGRPISIIDHEFEVELPSPFELNYATLPIPPAKINESTPILIMEAEEALRQHIPIYSAFIHLVTLAQIMGQVLVGLHSTRAKNQDRNNNFELVNVLERNLANWKLSLPPELQIDLSTSTSNYNTIQACVVNMAYGCVSMLLYRPFIRKQNIEDSNMAFKALNICTTTAAQLINIVDSMERNYFIALPWNMSVYSVFQAAIVFLHNAKGKNEFLREQGRQYLMKCSKICISDIYFQNNRIVKVLTTIAKNFDVSMEEDSASNNNIGRKRNSNERNNIISNNNINKHLKMDNTNLSHYLITSFNPLSGTTRPEDIFLASLPLGVKNSSSTFQQDSCPASNDFTWNTTVPGTTAAPQEYNYDLSSLCSQVPLWDIPSGVTWNEWENFLKANIVDNNVKTSTV